MRSLSPGLMMFTWSRRVSRSCDLNLLHLHHSVQIPPLLRIRYQSSSPSPKAMGNSPKPTSKAPGIFILGAGSIGSLIAHSLSTLPPPTPHITLLLRSPLSISTFQSPSTSSRITFTTPLTTTTASSPLPSFTPTTLPPSTKIESLIVTTKSHQTLSALAPYTPNLSSSSTILLLQNGLGAVELLETHLFPDPNTRPRILRALTTHGIKRLPEDPWHIIQSGTEGVLDIGYTFDSTQGSDSASRESAAALVEALERCKGLNTRLLPVKMLPQRQMLKLAQNCGINPITAVFGIRNGEVLENEKAVGMMKMVAKEVAEVLKKVDGEEGEEWSEEVLFERMKRLCEDTAGNTSSMLADVQAGRETEVEFINGWVVKKGEEVGVKCPVNKELIRKVKALGKEA